MKYAPHILGGVILAALGGALSGAAVGETDMLQRTHADTLPESRIVTAGNDALQNGSRPPDHYPLETPEGTIKVAELALHGRLRDSGRDLWWEDSRRAQVELAADGYDFYATASEERLAREEALLAFTGSRAAYQDRREARAAMPREREQAPQRLTRAEAPMALAEPAEVAAPAQQERAPQPARASREPSTGNAKTIDVAAALAARD